MPVTGSMVQLPLALSICLSHSAQGMDKPPSRAVHPGTMHSQQESRPADAKRAYHQGKDPAPARSLCVYLGCRGCLGE